MLQDGVLQRFCQQCSRCGIRSLRPTSRQPACAPNLLQIASIKVQSGGLLKMAIFPYCCCTKRVQAYTTSVPFTSSSTRAQVALANKPGFLPR